MKNENDIPTYRTYAFACLQYYYGEPIISKKFGTASETTANNNFLILFIFYGLLHSYRKNTYNLHVYCVRIIPTTDSVYTVVVQKSWSQLPPRR